jgi:hypothetical protein
MVRAPLRLQQGAPGPAAELQAYKRTDTGRVYTSISTPEALAYAERAFDARVRKIVEPALAAELRGRASGARRRDGQAALRAGFRRRGGVGGP